MKSIFASKTFWFNGAAALLAGALEISELFNLGVLTSMGIPEDKSKHIMASLGLLAAVINVILRKRTRDGVYITQKPDGD